MGFAFGRSRPRPVPNAAVDCVSGPCEDQVRARSEADVQLHAALRVGSGVIAGRACHLPCRLCDGTRGRWDDAARPGGRGAATTALQAGVAVAGPHGRVGSPGSQRKRCSLCQASALQRGAIRRLRRCLRAALCRLCAGGFCDAVLSARRDASRAGVECLARRAPAFVGAACCGVVGVEPIWLVSTAGRRGLAALRSVARPLHALPAGSRGPLPWQRARVRAAGSGSLAARLS
mmetsp:Transcript_62732/g.187016  ORF Transcript_62732/g.187016 Transcript_62732/m.187016 type:complete len:233 (-) Transcript_62732:1311-2009(-)